MILHRTPCTTVLVVRAGPKCFSVVKSSNYWISNESLLLSGRDYVGSLACKGGYSHTRLRALKGNRNNNARCDCCGRIESLPHILQSCPQTKINVWL